MPQLNCADSAEVDEVVKVVGGHWCSDDVCSSCNDTGGLRHTDIVNNEGRRVGSSISVDVDVDILIVFGTGNSPDLSEEVDISQRDDVAGAKASGLSCQGSWCTIYSR